MSLGFGDDPEDDPLYSNWLMRKRKWWDWHLLNPLVWEYFRRFSFEAVDAGVTKTSHWLIMGRIRWEVHIVTRGSEYKISNDLFAFYARFWKSSYPAHAELFKTKHMKGEPRDSPLIGG